MAQIDFGSWGGGNFDMWVALSSGMHPAGKPVSQIAAFPTMLPISISLWRPLVLVKSESDISSTLKCMVWMGRNFHIHVVFFLGSLIFLAFLSKTSDNQSLISVWETYTFCILIMIYFTIERWFVNEIPFNKWFGWLTIACIQMCIVWYYT